MKCPYCGTENLEDAKECTACKASLETPEVIEEDSDSNITLTLGNAQAQMQEAPKLTAAPLPVLEKEEQPKTLTEQFIAQKEKERQERPVLTEDSKVEPSAKPSFDKERLFGVLCYLNMLGVAVSYFFTRDKQTSFIKTHLNQGFIINLAFILGRYIPIIGSYIRFACFIAACVGIYYSATGQDKKLPVIGDIKLLG